MDGLPEDWGWTDWFIQRTSELCSGFGFTQLCYFGLRVSDLLKLGDQNFVVSSENVVKNEDNKYLKIVAEILFDSSEVGISEDNGLIGW